jgi:small subunit ribosomal protein S16
MLKIRLQRVGRRNHAEFRVVVTESTRGPKSAKYLEMLGSYNPHQDKVELQSERIKYWLGQGAQSSGTVHNLLVSNKIIEGKKVNVLPKKTVPQKEEEPVQKEEVAASDTPAETEANTAEAEAETAPAA